MPRNNRVRRKVRRRDWFFAWTITMDGVERTIRWRNGKLSGDAALIAAFLEGAKHVPATIDPIPYSSGAGWRADPIVAQFILNRIGRAAHFDTNIPPPRWVEGRVY